MALWGRLTPVPVYDRVEGGKFIVEADMPRMLGGWGTRPAPIYYCLRLVMMQRLGAPLTRSPKAAA